MKRSIRVTVHDSVRRSCDEILNADPVPKLMLMPLTWQGDLRPVLDAYLEQLKPLENGLTLDRTLTAERIPHVLDLGRAWLGDFTERMLTSYSEEPGAVDATEVLTQVRGLRREMGTGDPKRIADSLKRVREAANRLGGRDEHGAFSEGRRVADGLLSRHHVGDFSRPASIDDINRRNAAFWNGRSVTPASILAATCTCEVATARRALVPAPSATLSTTCGPPKPPVRESRR